MEFEDRERLIKDWSQKIQRRLEELLPRKLTEADFRREIDPLLTEFCEDIGVHPIAHAEYTLATGRADAVFNRFVIEYERPGVLKSPPDSATRHAIQQVRDYMIGLAQRERQKIDRLAGVVFDGNFFIFVRFIGGHWIVEPPVAVNVHSLERFLTWLAGLSSGIALTSENLNQDFSIEQMRTQNVLRRLFQALEVALKNPQGLVPKLFHQWKIFFSEAIDYSEAFGGRKLEPLKKWVRKAALEVRTPEEAERFFFVLHTYFALLVKLLAWLALSRHLGVRLGALSFSGLAAADGETLRRQLQEMESGGIFRAYGITNLLEGDFFSWYLYAWNDKIEDALREVIKRLNEYDPTTLTLVPEETRDLFKKLYHYLLPREIRHSLGEYYTPDWLAQRLLVQLDSEFFTANPSKNEGRMRQKLMNTRFLDPACGSGTFLVLIIARMLELGRALLVPESELLESILRNVVGFDLNPLAVLTARVNYLLAITDLLEHRRGEITIPVYLADSVRTPSLGEDLPAQGAYRFPTAVGEFLVPEKLCTKEHFDWFTNLLEDSVRSGISPESFVHQVQSRLPSESPLDERDKAFLRDLYETMLDLHRQGLNGLWARLLKNNFAPLTVGEFDYIVGNPPWVNWEHLPDKYRHEIKPIWEKYGLFPHGGMDTILGKGKKDISMLMTFTVVDRLLKTGGKLGFVITQSIFKTSGAGQGFRRFQIPHRNQAPTLLASVHVDDMVDLNPFEGASNRTAVMVLEKGRPTKYPVPYTVWRKRKGARFTYESTLEEVVAATRRLNFFAEPVDPTDPTSPWLTARPKALQAVRKILGKSDYEAHAGVYTGGANAVYWVEVVYRRPDGLVVVRNLTEGAKVQVDEVTEAMEPDLLYPLLRGRDVGRWRAEPSAMILMVQDPLRRRGIDEKDLQTRYPRTYGYLKRFEEVLRERASRGVSDMLKQGAPFYTMFAVGDYTFAPWKVVWPWISPSLVAAVIGTDDTGKVIVPEHNTSLVAFDSAEEAHFFCACFNSKPADFAAISSYPGGGGGIASPQVVERIRIPRYDPSNPVHRRLAELSQEAHEAARRGDERALRQIETEIDRHAAQLWGLSDEELAEIQRSLRELGREEQEGGEEE
ncbi:SAM-dependent DNA methyltransferase [Candidatus Bipolaricaulota bacterium]|nr:SAM-dependent DNA methyltransferase [Candidatus Bipolaricaulota bacterium]